MRIAFVTPNYPPDLGGIPVVVGELARQMARAGHKVEVFTHESLFAPAGTEQLEEVVVRRFRVPLPSERFAVSPSLLGSLVRRRGDFDVVHAHNFSSSPALSAAVARIQALVFTPHYHGGGHSRAAKFFHLFYGPLARLLLRRSAHIVCVSAAEARLLRSDFPNVQVPISVIPNGVRIESFRSAEPFNTSRRVVVAAGRIERYKRFDRVVLAAQHLPGDIEVILLGDGPERPALLELVEHLNLKRRVRLLGRVTDDELRGWFRTASVLVTMSEKEAFGLTVLEALAAETSVVASDIPAHRELAEAHPGAAIRLLSTGAPPVQIARAVEDASSDAFPEDVHIDSWEDIAGRLLEIYESCVV